MLTIGIEVFRILNCMILLDKRFHSKAFSAPYLSPLCGFHRCMKGIRFLRSRALRHGLPPKGVGVAEMSLKG
jgi:hypothetical protein